MNKKYPAIRLVKSCKLTSECVHVNDYGKTHKYVQSGVYFARHRCEMVPPHWG